MTTTYEKHLPTTATLEDFLNGGLYKQRDSGAALIALGLLAIAQAISSASSPSDA